MSVGAKIFSGIVAVQVASAALILGWYFYSLQSELASLARQDAQRAVLGAIGATEGYFLPAEDTVQAAQYLLSDQVLGRNRPGELERYFFEQLQLRPHVAGIYVGYPDGSFFYVMRSDEEAAGGTRTKIIRQGPEGREVELVWRDPDYAEIRSATDPEDPYDPRTRTWYQAALAEQSMVWTAPYIFFTSRQPGITLAAPIEGADGAVAAVLGLDIEMSEISSFLRRSSLGIGGSSFIATSRGEVVAHSGIDPMVSEGSDDGDGLRFRNISELSGIEGDIGERLRSRFSQPLGAMPASVWEEESDGQDYIVAIGQMSEIKLPWQVIAIVPATRESEIGDAANLILIAVILAATLLACLVGYLLSRKLGGPVAALHRNATLARNGNVEMLAEVTTGDREIDETAQALHDLAVLRRRDQAAPNPSPPPSSPGRDAPE
jgi:hypothetical protein